MTTVTKVSYQGAVSYAIGSGILAALLWFGITVLTGWQIGFVAIGVGYLVGWGVYWGAGKVGNFKLQILSAVVTLISIFMGEYLITNHFVYKSLIEEGYDTLYFLKVLPVIETTFSAVGENPSTILFWVIALVAGYTMARKREEGV